MSFNMDGSIELKAPKELVWDKLNDAQVLKECIPGCESLESEGDTGFRAIAKIKIGPVSARFMGVVTLSDIDAPNGYKISGSGEGGLAGFAKGGAIVSLAEDGAVTRLSYTVDAQIGGKLAQLGQRLIAGTAKKLADEFFKKFAAIVEESAGGETRQ